MAVRLAVTKPSLQANRHTPTAGVQEHQVPATPSRTSPTSYTPQVSLQQCSVRTAVRGEQTTFPGSHTPAHGTAALREASPATARPAWQATRSMLAEAPTATARSSTT